jgi:hypothetical protein
MRGPGTAQETTLPPSRAHDDDGPGAHRPGAVVVHAPVPGPGPEAAKGGQDGVLPQDSAGARSSVLVGRQAQTCLHPSSTYQPWATDSRATR